MTDRGMDSAFPLPPESNSGFGLNKREHFAALALQGRLAGDTSLDPDDPITWEIAAHSAVKQADALIAALNAPQESPR